MSREADIVRLRRNHPHGPIELYIKDGNATHVFVLRVGQLDNMLIDGVMFRLGSSSDSPWRDMWSRKFDYPELLGRDD